MQNENVLILTNAPSFLRKVGILLFVSGIASFFFAYFGADYFAGNNFTSKIVYILVSVFLGIIFSALGWMMISAPDRKVEINSETRKIYLTEKFIRAKFEEFSFDDVEKVELIQHELENSTLYLPQIILRGGKIIKIPSENEGDEKKQTEIFEQARNLLAK